MCKIKKSCTRSVFYVNNNMNIRIPTKNSHQGIFDFEQTYV